MIPLPNCSQSHRWGPGNLYRRLVDHRHIYWHWLLGLLLRGGVVHIHKWWHVQVHDHFHVRFSVHDWKLERCSDRHRRTVKLVALSTKVKLIQFLSLVKYWQTVLEASWLSACVATFAAISIIARCEASSCPTRRETLRRETHDALIGVPCLCNFPGERRHHLPIQLNTSDEGAQPVAITTRKLRHFIKYARRGLAAHECIVNGNPVVWRHSVQVHDLIVWPNLPCSATLSCVVHLAQVTVNLGRIHSSEHGIHSSHCMVHYWVLDDIPHILRQLGSKLNILLIKVTLLSVWWLRGFVNQFRS